MFLNTAGLYLRLPRPGEGAFPEGMSWGAGKSMLFPCPNPGHSKGSCVLNCRCIGAAQSLVRRLMGNASLTLSHSFKVCSQSDRHDPVMS